MSLFIAENRSLRLSALCVLYVSQGLPDGFVRTGLKTYLIREGASTAEVAGLIALVSWPWAIKWVWGPVIDRFSGSRFGRRRPWILAAQVAMALTLGSMLFISESPPSIRLLGFAVLLINCFSSMQDVAIDALAIDVLPERERGVANGLMFGSADVGRFLGGAVVGGALLAYGVKTAVVLEISLLLAIAMCPLLLRERRGDTLLPWRRRRFNSEVLSAQTPSPSIAELVSQLGRAFSQRASALAALLAIFSLTATSAHLVFWPVYLQRELGWSSEEYLRLEGVYGVGFGLAGSLVGGVLASWLGAKRSVILALILLAGCWFAYAGYKSLWDDRLFVTCLFCTVAWLANLFQVAMFALFMGVCRSAVAATQFSTYMALLNVSGILGATLAAHVDAQWPPAAAFTTLACLQLGMVAVVVCIPTLPPRGPDAPSTATAPTLN